MSKVANVDHRSVQMEGLLVTRTKKQQTMSQYDLVPEVIYNSLEIKIRTLMRELL